MPITDVKLLLCFVLLFFPTFHRASLAGNVEIIELLLSKVSGKKSSPKHVVSGRGNVMWHLSERSVVVVLVEQEISENAPVS